jgi:hypothetical protein
MMLQQILLFDGKRGHGQTAMESWRGVVYRGDFAKDPQPAPTDGPCVASGGDAPVPFPEAELTRIDAM